MAKLVKQPRVLDGDDGLGGEGLDEFDLLVGERPDEAAHQHKHTNRLPFAKQRNAQVGVHVLKAGNVRHPEFGIGFGVYDLSSLTSAENAANDRSSVRFGWNGMFVHVLVLFWRIAVARHLVEKTIPAESDCRVISTAESRRRFDQRVEHGL